METEWIKKAASQYVNDLNAKRREYELNSRKHEIERLRLNRIATEGPIVGAELWASLQFIIKSNGDEFNAELGSNIVRTKALGDGTFEVHVGEPGGAEKKASLAYAPDTTILSWQVFGGVKGTPLKVGIEPNTSPHQMTTNNPEFTDGLTYYKLERISQNILTNLLS